MDNINPSVNYTFSIDKDDFTRAGIASSSIKKTLRQLGIESSKIRRASIAAYEAEINIVIHSEGGSITLSVFPEFIEITAEDKGPGIEDVELAMKEGFSTASEMVREMGFGAGMGLSNMKKCADYFNIDTTKGHYTKVTMRINI